MASALSTPRLSARTAHVAPDRCLSGPRTIDVQVSTAPARIRCLPHRTLVQTRAGAMQPLSGADRPPWRSPCTALRVLQVLCVGAMGPHRRRSGRARGPRAHTAHGSIGTLAQLRRRPRSSACPRWLDAFGAPFECPVHFFWSCSLVSCIKIAPGEGALHFFRPW